MEHEARLVLLASGNGSNVQAVIDACSRGQICARVVAVVSDRADALALQRADHSGIPDVHVGKRTDETRADYDARLADVVSGFQPDHVVLLGWMRILTMSFLGWFPGMVINLHPALPGQLPGTDAVERAFAEFERGERTSTGVMMHLVPDEGVDAGPVLATTEVPIQSDDTLGSLTERIHQAEHQLVVATLARVCGTAPAPKEINA
jgi:phosphoribosylglycinamide formyltransferase 1